MADEENNNECKCTGWKAGFFIFVALCIIFFLIAIILFFMSGKKKDEAKKGVYGKIGKFFTDKSGQTYQVMDSSTEEVPELIQEGGKELERLLSSATH